MSRHVAVLVLLLLVACATAEPFEARFESVGVTDSDRTPFGFENVRRNLDPETKAFRQVRALAELTAAASDLRPSDSKSQVFAALGHPALYSESVWVYFNMERGMVTIDPVGEGGHALRYLEVRFVDGRYESHAARQNPAGIGLPP